MLCILKLAGVFIKHFFLSFVHIEMPMIEAERFISFLERNAYYLDAEELFKDAYYFRQEFQLVRKLRIEGNIKQADALEQKTFHHIIFMHEALKIVIEAEEGKC